MNKDLGAEVNWNVFSTIKNPLNCGKIDINYIPCILMINL